MGVHRELGPGFPEEYYQRALEHEFGEAKLQYEAQKPIRVSYKNIPVGLSYFDFLIQGELVLEIKSCSRLDDVHLAQVLRYLAAANLDVGLLVNFGESSLKFKNILLPVKLQEERNVRTTNKHNKHN
jgi:GxxExxY protein